MPAQLTYPGVYIEEIPSGVRTIVGVKTSVTAFIGYTKRGPTNAAVQLFNWSDFERNFGGIDQDSDASYAIAQYFLNGGSEAWVVRVAKGASKAAISLKNYDNALVLKVEAKNEGDWGNNLRLDVDYDTSNPDSLFNLKVIEYIKRDGMLQIGHTELYRNLSMNSRSPAFVEGKINAASNLINATRVYDVENAIFRDEKGKSTSDVLTEDNLAGINDDHRRLAISINGDGPYEFDLFDPGNNIPGGDIAAKLDNLAAMIKEKVRAIKPGDTAFVNFNCWRSANEDKIVCESGKGGEASSVRLINASIRDAASRLKLGTSNGGKEEDASAKIMPAMTGTVGNDLSGPKYDLNNLPDAGEMKVKITVGQRTTEETLNDLWVAETKPHTIAAILQCLESRLRASSIEELKGSNIALIGNRLRIVAGGTNPNAILEFENLTGTNIGLANHYSNISYYALGVGDSLKGQGDAKPGSDGMPLDPAKEPADLKIMIGSRTEKTGIYALEDVDIFNILCIPNQGDSNLLADAIKYCEERRAMMIVDIPENIDTKDKAVEWLKKPEISTLRHRNAAAYFPRIRASDPAQDYRLRAFPPCGAIAGLFSSTDRDRGVWKAPAGIDASLRGVKELSYNLTDLENGVLNQLGLNCLRTFPAYGNVVWGTRTLRGSDQLADEYKYIPVRRLVLYIEESLYRGTKWVIFEPNDEPLWAQIRLNVGAFMHNLFRQHAFQGMTPKEAYFVKCDKETTTQSHVDLGIVNIVVGFAPLKPAEFVVIKIQQIAGQIQT